MEMSIDEALMNEFIKMTGHGEENAHRGLNALLRDVLMLGYLHRDNHKIILHNIGVDSEFDEEYQIYLDRKASNIQPENWEDKTHNPISND
jgi:hypothetical protein